MTEPDWEAIRAQPCGICEQPYHRYCDHDPEHEWAPTACINSLRHEVDRLRNQALWAVATITRGHEQANAGVRALLEAVP